MDFTQMDGVRSMLKFMLFRRLERTGQWVSCGHDRYLVESKAMHRPQTGKLQQNLLKIEINPYGIALE
jgi:hypothetical protein